VPGITTVCLIAEPDRTGAPSRVDARALPTATPAISDATCAR